MKDGVNATPLPTVNTTGYIDHAAFLGTINPDTNKIPKHLRSEERFSRNAETDLVCRLLLEKKKHEAVLRRNAAPDLEGCELCLQLRWLSIALSPDEGVVAGQE